jgi:CheY-like chemotaxis protein
VIVLLVEDSLGDERLVREALASFEWIELHVAHDGVEALRLLESMKSRLDLILLDLNLPRMDGRTLLSLVKSDPALRAIPLVVLTSSSAPDDARQAYAMHANCYVVKPREFADFERTLQRVIEFWTEQAYVPSRS